VVHERFCFLGDAEPFACNESFSKAGTAARPTTQKIAHPQNDRKGTWNRKAGAQHDIRAPRSFMRWLLIFGHGIAMAAARWRPATRVAANLAS